MTRGILSLIAALCLLLTGCSRGGQAPFGIDPRSAVGASAGACNSKTLLPVLLESPDVDYARTMWNIGLDEPTCIDDWAMASTTSESPGFQRVRVLFHRVNGTWQYVTLGGNWDCVSSSGVPPEIAEELQGCSEYRSFG